MMLNTHRSEKHGCIYQRLKKEGLEALKWAERSGFGGKKGQ